MSPTVSARLPVELNGQVRRKCNELGCTVNDYIKEAIETKLTGPKREDGLSESMDYEDAFEHMKECPNCNRAIMSKGYIMVSLEELKKYRLEPVGNQMLKMLIST